MRTRRGLPLSVVMTVALLCATGAFSQSVRVTKIIVPFAPGGGIDVVARIVAQQVGELAGPVMIVENHPGGGTILATEDVLRAAPDSGTLLFNNNSFAVAPQFRKVDFNPLSDLTAVCKIATTPTVIIVNANSPYRTLNDLIEAARAKPGTLTFGAVAGAIMQIGFEMFQRAADMHLTFVPYNGTLPEVTAILAGQIDAALVDYPVAAGQIQAQKIRALAVGSTRRAAFLPDVPTMAEAGFKGYELELWYGMFGPAHMPANVTSPLAAWFNKAIHAPQTAAKLADQGVTPSGQCGADFAAYVRGEYERYGRAIRDANIKAE
jgi:tripartite-type tricarboxylate transporter receptor subunit TctC